MPVVVKVLDHTYSHEAEKTMIRSMIGDRVNLEIRNYFPYFDQIFPKSNSNGSLFKWLWNLFFWNPKAIARCNFWLDDATNTHVEKVEFFVHDQNYYETIFNLAGDIYTAMSIKCTVIKSWPVNARPWKPEENNVRPEESSENIGRVPIA